MKRMTVDLIMRSPAFRNKIPRIENLGVTQDQFDTIDFSNNEIEILEDFPILRRCSTLFFNNNIVRQIIPNFADSLPNLHILMLTHNDIRTFQQLGLLQKCRNLVRLSLYLDPVSTLPNYRSVTVQMIPTLNYLDFQKVTAQDVNIYVGGPCRVPSPPSESPRRGA
jgi:U2 small nuclear ribonucleoprotein A'